MYIILIYNCKPPKNTILEVQDLLTFFILTTSTQENTNLLQILLDNVYGTISQLFEETASIGTFSGLKHNSKATSSPTLL